MARPTVRTAMHPLGPPARMLTDTHFWGVEDGSGATAIPDVILWLWFLRTEAYAEDDKSPSSSYRAFDIDSWLILFIVR